MADSEVERIAGNSERSQPKSMQDVLRVGCVIPAHPLALDGNRQLDERHQRALSRYYLAAGAGGLAVGVHTTQFAIRDSSHGLLKAVWSLAAEEMDRNEAFHGRPLVRVAGVCGDTQQAVREASLARDLGYQLGLINLGSSRNRSVSDLIHHTKSIADTIDVFGFYLQVAVGGIDLPREYWQLLCEIPAVRAIKVAAFDRYKTLTVVRAVAESGRDDVALYTGNDDNIIFDLITPFRFPMRNQPCEKRFVGGLLGQWAVGTRRAVEIHNRCRHLATSNHPIPPELLQLAVELTDMNAAVFDADHTFHGCVPGIHEVLRRQGLLPGAWCLDPLETLSVGQAKEIDRVLGAYPHLSDDAFIDEHRDEWFGR